MSADVRAMLTRVAKLEAARVNPQSPTERAYGTFDAFESMCHEGMEAGRCDLRDMVQVLNGLRRMHDDRVWDRRQRRQPVWGLR